MKCETAREALSARIDGEHEPVPTNRVDEHLAGCAPCQVWHQAAVEQTQALRRLAGRSQVAAVRTPAPAQPARLRAPWWSWRRAALGAVGVAQLCLALAQGLGAHLGLPEAAAGHVLNESTAWSAALGVAMVVAAIKPATACGLAWVLVTFAALLLGYEVIDTDGGAVSADRAVTHLPVVAGALLAVLVWRLDSSGGGPQPDKGSAAGHGDIVLPGNSSRVRRRGRLRPADESAA